MSDTKPGGDPRDDSDGIGESKLRGGFAGGLQDDVQVHGGVNLGDTGVCGEEILL